jgi:hypothetical protein
VLFLEPIVRIFIINHLRIKVLVCILESAMFFFQFQLESNGPLVVIIGLEEFIKFHDLRLGCMFGKE